MKSFGIVSVEHNGFRCSVCKENRHSCCHVCCLQTYLESRQSVIPDFLIDIVEANETIRNSIRQPYTRSAISTKIIPFAILPSQRSIFTGFLNDAVDLSSDEVFRIRSDFISNCCPSCNQEFSGSTQWIHNRKLYTQKLILEVSGREVNHKLITTIS